MIYTHNKTCNKAFVLFSTEESDANIQYQVRTNKLQPGYYWCEVEYSPNEDEDFPHYEWTYENWPERATPPRGPYNSLLEAFNSGTLYFFCVSKSFCVNP